MHNLFFISYIFIILYCHRYNIIPKRSVHMIVITGQCTPITKVVGILQVCSFHLRHIDRCFVTDSVNRGGVQLNRGDSRTDAVDEYVISAAAVLRAVACAGCVAQCFTNLFGCRVWVGVGAETVLTNLENNGQKLYLFI